MQLLVIEDNDGDIRLLREMLQEQGLRAEVTSAGNMIDAEKHLGKRDFDIVLLDPGLPDKQGLSSVRRVRSVAPRVPLVVVTGGDDKILETQSLRAGAQEFLLKSHLDAPGLAQALRCAVERKLLDEAVSEAIERAQAALNSIGDAIVCTDLLGRITYLNVVATRLSGSTTHHAMGLPFGKLFPVLNASTRKPIAEDLGLRPILNGPTHLPLNCVLVCGDGSDVPVEGSVAPIHDRMGRLTGGVTVLRKVSSARAQALKMAHSAEHDFLTGLPNRMLLRDRLNQALSLATRRGKKVAVMFLDLDRFKHVNDSLGHFVGDGLLQSVAGRLAACVRQSDTVSRQGGDEFVVLLPEIEQPEDAAITARRMLQAVSECHTVGRHQLHLTTSIGVSVYPDDGADAEMLMRNADTAMYQAKANGGQSYTFFRPAMNTRATERYATEDGLRLALARREFTLAYQPKIHLATGKIIGAEALIRWTHPKLGPVPPSHFIPIAEDCGLIVPIGSWVMREACSQAQAWVEAGLPIMSMSVNVSGVEFRDSGFLRGLFAILHETGYSPGSLQLEVTEKVLMKCSTDATLLKALTGKGVELAVDDFGSGYASLNALLSSPVSSLKIGQSFVRRIGEAGQDPSLIKAAIAMAHSLKLRVAAGGIEAPEELAFLKAHHCDEGQGYFFNSPVPAPEFAKLLT